MSSLTRELALLAQGGRAQAPVALGTPAQEAPPDNVPGLSLSLPVAQVPLLRHCCEGELPVL